MESNPYNKNNFLLTESFLNEILNQVDIKINSCNIELYQKSFVHESYRKLKCYEKMTNTDNCLQLQNESYERLEFIGDALIESIVANYLYSRYHEIYNQDEGFLSKLKMRIVCGKNLSKLSNKLNLKKYIIISKSIEDKYNGRVNMCEHKILCDVFEAFCGALYKDTKNYEIVEKFVINSIEKYLDLSEFIINDTNYKDQLWRYMKKTYDKYPEKNTINVEDEYLTQIKNGEEIIGEFKSDDKKESEQLASREALKHYGILN
jgi:ribonuclease III